MKNFFFLTGSSFLTASIIYFLLSPKVFSYRDTAYSNSNLNRSNFGCSANLSAIDFADSANTIPLLEGWGSYRMPVTYKNDSAYTYFQQGINMYYGFHIIEALASFEKATQFDPEFAMAYWGKALAYGPNINDIGYAASPEALAAIKKAKELSEACTPVEKGLIEAMQVRYSADSTQKREHLNQLYADAMKQVVKAHPNSADAAALYADALMVQHPWDLYDRTYSPKPWTPQIVAVLEGLIKKFPEHPGAGHYYIHAVEGSKHPQRAMQIADRLGQLMPGVAHLVHMPSHIYIRSGKYNKGVKVNEEAVGWYYKNLSRFPITSNNSFLYLVHNLHMQASCAAMDGQYAKALKYSFDTQKSFDSIWMDAGGYFGMYSQYLYMTPYITMIRFGKWDDILKASNVPASRVYATSMMNFAKGLAYARKHDFEKAADLLQKLDDSLTSTQLTDHPAAFNPGSEAVEVAMKVLSGVIEEERGNYAKAITLFKEAVDQEDGMLYNEPKDWVLPTRQYLGQALLKAKQYGEAATVYTADLKINPDNVWSLTGLSKALQNGNRPELAKVDQQKKLAMQRNDVKISSSVY